MRFLQMISSMGVNGAVMHGVRFARLLAAHGHEVVVAALPGSWAARELDGVLEVFPTTLQRRSAELARTAEFCRARGVQVTHSHLTRAHGFGCLLERCSGVPHIAHAHSHHRQLHWLFQRRILALSAREEVAHRRWYFKRPDQVALLFNYIDSAGFQPVEPDPRVLHRALGVPADARVVACIAGIIPRKGQLALVRAWPAVVAATPRARLVLFGHENEKPEYAALVRAEAARLGVADQIVWAGFRADMPALVPHCALAVAPSLDEPFALSALEAMACGVPVVATQVGGFPEMITPGVNGLLVPPRDPAALAGALMQVLENEPFRRQLGLAARVRIERDFTAAVHYARYMEILRTWKIAPEGELATG